MPDRAMTLRLDADLADLVDLLAATSGMNVSQVIRSAIRTYARDVRRSPKFQEQAAAYLERQRVLLLEAGPIDPWADGEPGITDLLHTEADRVEALGGDYNTAVAVGVRAAARMVEHPETIPGGTDA